MATPTDKRAVTESTVLNPLYDARLNSFDRSEYANITDQFSLEWNILPGMRFRSSLAFFNPVNIRCIYITA